MLVFETLRRGNNTLKVALFYYNPKNLEYDWISPDADRIWPRSVRSSQYLLHYTILLSILKPPSSILTKRTLAALVSSTLEDKKSVSEFVIPLSKSLQQLELIAV